MPRKKESQPAILPVETAALAPVGSLVAYYLDGWRYGYVEEVRKTSVVVRPIAPKNGAQPRSIVVAKEDVKYADKNGR